MLRRHWRPIAVAVAVVASFLGVAPGASAATDCASPDTYSHEETTGSLYNVRAAIGADDVAADGTGVDVAVIDTGVAPVPGLDGADKVVNGPDLSFEAGVDDLRHLDTYGHGTHMAGIIGADGDVDGIAPGARIVNIKVADSAGAVDPTQVLAAINWVIEHKDANGLNIRVLSISYGVPAEDIDYVDDPLAVAVEAAWDAGIVVVAAAGNDGRKEKSLASPAHDPYVIAVDAYEDKRSQNGKGDCLRRNQNWKSAKIGSSGKWSERTPDIGAPGRTIVSLRVPGSRIDQDHPASRISPTLTKGTGTSQAAAVVSGAVAVLLDARPDLSPDEVKALLVDTADDRGMLDLADAVNGDDDDDDDDSVVQAWPRATGAGSIDALRHDVVTFADGSTLTGETAALLDDWSGSTWTGSTWTGSTWTGSTWTGSTWTGGSWMGSTWTGSTWTGSTWTGSTWTGSTWTGSTWTGSTWTGSTWTGSTWTGSTWTGSTWTGSTWT